MTYLMASVRACSSGLPFKSARPYGATLHGWPDTLNWPFDCFTWYAATGWSRNPTSARPDSSAELASVCFSKLRTWIADLPAALQLSLAPDCGAPPTPWPMYPQASLSSVVPDSTATFLPHTSAVVLIVGPPCALTMNDSPAR